MENFRIFLAVLIGLLIINVLLRHWWKRRKIKTPDEFLSGETEASEQEVEGLDYNEEFLAKSEGEEPIRYLRIYSPREVALLRAYLAQEGILTYSEFDHMNNLFPGIGIKGYTDAVLTVFEKDLNQAVRLTEEYIQSRYESRGRLKVVERARGIAEWALGGYVVASHEFDYLPEVMRKLEGIEDKLEDH